MILGGGAIALAFLKIGGKSLPVHLMNFLSFSISPKIYIWKKMKRRLKILKKQEFKKKEEDVALKMTREGKLKKLHF